MSEIFHYCGHIISKDESGRFPKSNELDVQHSIDRLLQNIDIASCYGSLAAGADILIAERMLHKGASLHVILPFDKMAFIDFSVQSSGDQWTSRFNTLLDRSSSITQIFYNRPESDIVSYALCTEIALGLSLFEGTIKGDVFPNYPQQLTIWDKQKTNGPAGTYPDMLRANKLQLKIRFISSIKPINANRFNEQTNITFQSLNIAIYDRTNYTKILMIKDVGALEKYLDKHSDRTDLSIDLDRDIYGLDEQINKMHISDRALGHITFHCYIDQNFYNRESFLFLLLKIKKMNNVMGIIYE